MSGKNVKRLMRKTIRKELAPLARLVQGLADNSVEPTVHHLPALLKGAEGEQLLAVLSAVREEIDMTFTRFSLETVRSMHEETEGLMAMLEDRKDILEETANESNEGHVSTPAEK